MNLEKTPEKTDNFILTLFESGFFRRSLCYGKTWNACLVPTREIRFCHLQEPYRHGAHGDQFLKFG